MTAAGRSPKVNESGRACQICRSSVGLAVRKVVRVVRIPAWTSWRNVVLSVQTTVLSVTVHGAAAGHVGSAPPEVPPVVARHRGRPLSAEHLRLCEDYAAGKVSHKELHPVMDRILNDEEF